MTTDQIITRAGEHYFGCCPTCHETDGYLNIGKGHWFFCEAHKTRWYIGSNLFSTWQDQTEDEQRAIYEEHDFGSFEKVAETTCPWPSAHAEWELDRPNSEEN